MTEPEDAMLPSDVVDLGDARERALTLAALEGDASWPLGSVLPMRRGLTEADAETGYVRAEVPLTVLGTMMWHPGHPEKDYVVERTYASAEDLVNDGWRVD